MIISAVCFYPEYLPVFLSNVKWAFSKHRIKICILSYEKYKKSFAFDKNLIDLILFKNEDSFFPFYNEIHNIIKEKKSYDGYIFMQQDVLFTKVFEKDFFDGYEMCNFLNRPYLGIYKKEKMHFKRVWEACLFVSNKVIEQSIKDNIEFGNKKNQLVNFNISENLLVNYNNKILTIEKFINSESLDTMFEFSIWCYLKKIKIKDFSLDEDAEFGEGVIHFNGFEKIPTYELIRKKLFEFDLKKFSSEGKMYLNHLFLTSLFKEINWPNDVNKDLINYLHKKVQKINFEWLENKKINKKLFNKVF